MIYRPMLTLFVIPKKLFNALWKLSFALGKNPHDLGLFELEECPYCRFRASMDYWEDREMEQSFDSPLEAR